MIGLGILGTNSVTGTTGHAQHGASGDWTQYRANAASTARLAHGSGPTEYVTKAWDDSLSRGRNNDGVAVVGETVYTAGGDLRAVNAADGTKRWSFSPTVPDLDYPEGAGADVRHPAVMNGTVYASVGFEVYDTDAPQHTALIAVDAKTGTKRWRIDSDGLTDGIFSPVTAANGLVYTSGPVLRGSSGSDDGGLYAFDAKTGNVQWQRGTGWGALPVANGQVYLPAEGKGVQALDAATGERLWTALPEVTVSDTPMVANGTLFVTEDNSPGVTLIALDAATGTEQWRTAYPYAGEWPQITVGTVDSKRVYVSVGNIDTAVIALDRTSGTELWRASIPQPPKTDGEQLTRVPTHGFARVGSLLYVGGAALNPDTGAVVWTHGIPTPWISDYHLRAVAGGRVYIGGDNLVVLSGETEQKSDDSTETLTTTPTTHTKAETTPPSATETPPRSPTQTAAPFPTQTVTQSSTQTAASSPTQTLTSSSPMTSPTTETTPDTTIEQTTTANGPGFRGLTTVVGAGLGVWRYLSED
jgi:outer membrane protein assembly factor BamB